MNRIIAYLLTVLLFTNCTHRIVRTDYQADQFYYDSCEVILKKEMAIPDTMASKIGEVKLGESGFAVACSEKHAINILKDEACKISADMVLITKERRPDFWSTCYRCHAEFYQFKSPEYATQFKSDKLYDNEKVNKRVSRDRWKNTFIAIGSAFAGLAIGIIIVNS